MRKLIIGIAFVSVAMTAPAVAQEPAYGPSDEPEQAQVNLVDAKADRIAPSPAPLASEQITYRQVKKTSEDKFVPLFKLKQSSKFRFDVAATKPASLGLKDSAGWNSQRTAVGLTVTFGF